MLLNNFLFARTKLGRGGLYRTVHANEIEMESRIQCILFSFRKYSKMFELRLCSTKMTSSAKYKIYGWQKKKEKVRVCVCLNIYPFIWLKLSAKTNKHTHTCTHIQIINYIQSHAITRCAYNKLKISIDDSAIFLSSSSSASSFNLNSECSQWPWLVF